MNSIHLHNYEAFLLDYSEGTLSDAEVALLRTFLLEHPELEIDLEDFNLVYLDEEIHGFDFKQSLKKTEDQVPDEELINYLEGNSSLDEKITFELKLAQDRDLAKTLEDYKKTILITDSEITLSSKFSLQKSEDDLVLNNRLLAYFENQLSSIEKSELEKEISASATLQNELNLFSKTILVAEAGILHPDKEALKKEAKIIYFNLRTVGSIAAALLLVFGLALVYNYYGNKKTESSSLATTTSVETLVEPLATSTANLRIKESDAKAGQDISTSDKKTNFSSQKEAVATFNAKEPSQKNIEKQDIQIAKVEEPILKEPVIAKDETTEIASVQNKDLIDSTNKKNYLPLAENLDEENDLMELKESSLTGKKGLWKRAVLLAKQANKLGVKSVDGQENSKNNYRLSFNSFSVEKK